SCPSRDVGAPAPGEGRPSWCYPENSARRPARPPACEPAFTAGKRSGLLSPPEFLPTSSPRATGPGPSTEGGAWLMRIRVRLRTALVWGALLVLALVAGGLGFAYAWVNDSATLAALIRGEVPRYLPGTSLAIDKA